MNSKTKCVKPAVGIDLGTTHSCVAVFQNGMAEVIADSQGNRLTPSVVAFTGGGRIIGEGAILQKKIDPNSVIYNSKKFIGRRWDDQVVQDNASWYPFKIIEQNNKVKFETVCNSKSSTFTPEEVAAAILSRMKKVAEDYLEESVDDVVITVPAYFTDSQRQATKDAGKMAGLNVARIINEPTAATMAYGLMQGFHEFEGKHALVYDLGGGTFDVSVLRLENDLIQVKATGGNANLGGEDFNNLLVRHFKKEIFRKHNIDITPNHKAVSRLATACEVLKRNLSAENVTESKIDLENFLPNGSDFSSYMTRANFENICQELFKDTIKIVEKVLKDAELKKEDIDEVVLVGGSTRIPKLQTMLHQFFNNKALNKSINPDEAVACGAAVQAAILNNDQHTSVKEMLLMDVIPLSIGVDLYGDITRIILGRNTSIPVRKTHTLATSVNNQKMVKFTITEGERTMTKDNQILGKFRIDGLPPGKAEEVKFDMAFEVDANGILTVSATVRGTNKKGSITLDNTSSGNMSADEINQLVEDAKNMQILDETEENRILSRNKLISLCNHIKFISQDYFEEDVKEILKSVADDILFVTKNPKAEETQFVERHKSLKDKAKQILTHSVLSEQTDRSTQLLRLSKMQPKYYLKEGNRLAKSNAAYDLRSALVYFKTAYKIAVDQGKIPKQIEALKCFGHTSRVLLEADTDKQSRLETVRSAVSSLTNVLVLEKNKYLTNNEKRNVILDIEYAGDKFFKILNELEDDERMMALNRYRFMRTFVNSNTVENEEWRKVVFKCFINEIELFLQTIKYCLRNENAKDALRYIRDLNHPKEQAKLFVTNAYQEKQLTRLVNLIGENDAHARGLDHINLAVEMMDGVETDDPEAIDKALMALDHLSESKFQTEHFHTKLFIQANFWEGKIFMNPIMNKPKAKRCFEIVKRLSESKNYNTEEYRQSKYILEDLQEETEKEKKPNMNKEAVKEKLKPLLEMLSDANKELNNEKFVNFLFSAFPPKHKKNCKKPEITAKSSEKRAYILLSTFYHPDKVDANEHGEEYKILCEEISKYINARL